MSLFFEKPLSINVALIVRDGADDTLLVGRQLWEKLNNKDATVLGRIHVSISNITKRIGPTTSHSSVSAWAFLDNSIPDGHISIPRDWVHTYPHVIPSTVVRRHSPTPCSKITPVNPILLTEVFITALSQIAYDAAVANQFHLETWLCDAQRIIRQSAIYTCHAGDLIDHINGFISSEEKPLHFQVNMLEPVLQGYCERDKTTFFISPVTDGYVQSATLCPTDSVQNDGDRIEIGEDFLASSMGQPFQFPLDVNGDAFPDTDSEGSAPDINRTNDFAVRPLAYKPLGILEDQTVYARTADLGRIGILNGDWAIIENKHSSSKSRLARIVADDDLVRTPGLLSASPSLLYNICGDMWPPYSGAVQVYSSPFGSGPPVIPTAPSVTVARIASPISVDKTYQQAFLMALKSYFEGRPKLVKLGDIIAVAVNSDRRTYLGLGMDEILALTERDEEERNDEAVFFVVTNIEHSIVATDDSSSPDAYLGSTLGELGCWFDPSVTAMNQTGIEHARVPAVSSYLGLDVAPKSFTANLPSGTQGALGKLFEMASVILGKHSASYNLPLTALLSGSRGTGKYSTALSVAQLLGLHVLEINCYDAIGDNDTHTEGVLRARFEKALDCSPCLVILRQLDGLASKQGAESKAGSVMANVLRECLDDAHYAWKMSGYPIIVCGISNDSSKLPTDFVSSFKHEIIFEAPDEAERLEIIKTSLTGKSIAPDVSINRLATQTAALVAGDLSDLVNRAEVAAIERAGALASQHIIADIIQAGVSISNADLESALGKARASYSEGIGAPKIPDVSWDDVGGLAHVKADILDTIQLPLDYPDLFSDGFKKRSGILLYGPPGTGKTLVAKAVATSFALNFFSVKGPELLNMYIGESEANVRRIFQRARDAKPCVIFFDELDSIAPKRGNHGDSGGVMDRIVSQLLSELDGMAGSGGADVFVIGATNRPDLLDAALLRPGRFDRMLYLGVSKTHKEQLHILEALTRKFRLAPDLDLRTVAEQCSFNLTGADFYALCSDALLNAMTRKAEDLEKIIARLNENPEGHQHPHPITPQYYLAEVASHEEIAVLVTAEDFNVAWKNLIPSVSEAEMQHYAKIQQQFSQERSKPNVS